MGLVFVEEILYSKGIIKTWGATKNPHLNSVYKNLHSLSTSSATLLSDPDA